MCKRIILLIVVMAAFLCLVGCGEESVKYISADDDDIYSVTEEQMSEDTQEDVLDIESQVSSSSNTVPVYVCGAVENPGVYYLNPNSLKAEALSMAGGLTEDAALDYVNLAETVYSGEKIYFPYAQEVAEGGNLLPDESNQEVSGKININTATKSELMTLPGIGESKAEAIISYREEYGPFQSIEDITSISGIKEGVYNNIKDYIIVY